ncbi:hypothetical protein M9H77_14574 [Catharanthus roseus]|uniref:Uncharacterized protein n=1 Tax=Catharanthus roseus TaxID=4058 RepID=A0ACC0BNF3_CATRO|nr:hypothetical protein M9H77_14574 [Catharanthus roseus]
MRNNGRNSQPTRLKKINRENVVKQNKNKYISLTITKLPLFFLLSRQFKPNGKTESTINRQKNGKENDDKITLTCRCGVGTASAETERRRAVARNNEPHRGTSGKNNDTINWRTDSLSQAPQKHKLSPVSLSLSLYNLSVSPQTENINHKKPAIDLTETAAQKPKGQRRAAVIASRGQEEEEEETELQF